MKVVQNQQPDFEDIQPVIDGKVVDIVHDIFESVIGLNPLDDIFMDLANKLIEDLKANSLLEYNLELSDDQKDQLRKAIKQKGKEATEDYFANLSKDTRTKLAYGLVKEKTTEIADMILSTIGQEVNRGAVINAQAVQANSKNKAYDEILLRKSKSSGDITVPTSVIVISTNCVDVIKASCQEESGNPEGEGQEKKTEKAADKKPRKKGE